MMIFVVMEKMSAVKWKKRFMFQQKEEKKTLEVLMLLLQKMARQTTTKLA